MDLVQLKGTAFVTGTNAVSEDEIMNEIEVLFKRYDRMV